MSEHDLLQRFIFEQQNIRGQFVKLTHSWQQAQTYQTAPWIAREQLGQALVAVVMLAASIKFKGSIILQVQSNAAIKTLVAQASNALQIRGVVHSAEVLSDVNWRQLFGQGNLVLTITIDNHQMQSYQGIVALDGGSLANALETYFVQSEQLKTRLWLVANEQCAAGLFLQEIPSPEKKADWDSIEVLADTLTMHELVEMNAEHLLYRLFNQQPVRLFPPELVAFQCNCSWQRVEQLLCAMPKEDVERLVHERGSIDVNCEFCAKPYHFDGRALEIMLLNAENNATATHHY